MQINYNYGLKLCVKWLRTGNFITIWSLHSHIWIKYCTSPYIGGADNETLQLEKP